MKLADWMARKRINDTKVAALVNCDRATINRVRRGKHRPSWRLIDAIREISKGQVSARDWNSG